MRSPCTAGLLVGQQVEDVRVEGVSADVIDHSEKPARIKAANASKAGRRQIQWARRAERRGICVDEPSQYSLPGNAGADPACWDTPGSRR